MTEQPGDQQEPEVRELGPGSEPKEFVDRARERLDRAIDEAREELKELADEAREEFDELKEKAPEWIRDARHKVADFLEEFPPRKPEP